MWPNSHIYLQIFTKNRKHTGFLDMLDRERMPQHVAIIMDGNGRWAKKRGLPRLAGHNAGMKAMKKIVDHSDKLGIKYLTVYAFSTENWKRSVAEVSGIFKLLVTYVNSDLRELVENNVRVRVLGDYTKLPADAVKSLEQHAEGHGEQYGTPVQHRAELRRQRRDKESCAGDQRAKCSAGSSRRRISRTR